MLGGSVELCLTLRSLCCTLITKKRLACGRKCSSLYEYAASLCVLVRDENRQLIAILRANVIRKIPIAKIEGVSRLTFDDDGKLSRHEETLTLVEMVNAGKVRNKRIMRDVLEYLDTRKPPGVSLADWDIQVEDRVDICSVPGMRQLDVDGMEDSAGNIEDATVVLGFFTLVVISFGFGFGAWYLNGLKHEALFRQMLEEGAY